MRPSIHRRLARRQLQPVIKEALSSRKASPKPSPSLVGPASFSSRKPTVSNQNISRTYVTVAEDATPIPFPPPSLTGSETQSAAGISNIGGGLAEIYSILEKEIGGADYWLSRVESAISDSNISRRKRIGVYGDVLASPQDVVSALLQDPLADTETSRKTLLSRHEDSSSEVFHIRYGQESRRTGPSLSSQSSWLRSSGNDVVEVDCTDPETALSHLLSTDSVLVVLDPIRLLSIPQLSSMLPTLLSKGSIQFVVNGHLPPRTTESSIEETLRAQLEAVVVGDLPRSTLDIKVTFVQAEKALKALDALATGLSDEGLSSSQTKAFDVFQQQYLQSNLGPLQKRLLENTSTSSLETARMIAALALAYISSIISHDRTTTTSVSYTISQLRRTATQAGVRAKHLSVVNRGIDGGVVEGSVEQELQAVKRELDQTFRQRLNWLSLVGKLRVDDVGAEVGSHVEQRFGRRLEQRIIFETGQLAELQDSLSKSADKLLQQLSSKAGRASIPAPHPFSSRILLNHLSTLSLSIPPLESDSMLGPVTTRRQQLLGFPISKLQQSAQRTLLSSYATAFLSISMSWVAFVEPVALISSGTAFGTGILGSVAAFALGQRLWEKTQRTFWKDWDRIVGMMKGDLQAQFSTALDSQVMTKPLAAAEGLELLVKKREERLDSLQQRIDEIRHRLHI